MALDVHLHVCFPCDNNDHVAALAARHHAALPIVTDHLAPPYAREFLEDLMERRGPNPGPKGGLSLWGWVTNHGDGQRFVDALAAFWIDLLSGSIADEDYGGPADYERICVFAEREQRGFTTVWQIGLFDDLDDVDYSRPRRLEVKVFPDMPFSWAQA